MYTQDLQLTMAELQYYDEKINYQKILLDVLENEYCRRYSLGNDTITLSNLSYYFRKIISRSKARRKLDENDVCNLFKVIKILKLLKENTKCDILKDTISEMCEMYSNTFSIDNGVSTIDIDAFDSQLFMMLICFIDTEKMTLKFISFDNFKSFQILKSFLVMDMIEDLIRYYNLKEKEELSILVS